MFADRRNIRANPTEGFGTRHRAKTAGNLLLDFHHPQVALCQIVIKRHAEVGHQAQRFGLVLLQPQQQIARFALFRASLLPGLPALPDCVPGGHQSLIPPYQGFVRRRVQAFGAVCARATVCLMVRRRSFISCAQACPPASISAVSSRK